MEKSISYKTIRNVFQTNPVVEPVLVDKYCKILSPVFTMIFLRYNFSANQVTLLMIISGIIGGIFFSFKPLLLKFIGLLFIHLWYVLDCSDGEVARATQKFSTFGTELDFMSHISAHPIYVFAFLLTLLQYYDFQLASLFVLFFILVSSEMLQRHNHAMETIYKLKSSSYKHASVVNNTNTLSLRRVVSVLILLGNYFPNFALIFPVLFFVDGMFQTRLAPLYTAYFALGIFTTACINYWIVVRNFYKYNR